MDSYLYWAILSVFLLIIEFKTVYFYALWFAICAAFVAMVTFYLPLISIVEQLLIFSSVSILKLFYCRFALEIKRQDSRKSSN